MKSALRGLNDLARCRDVENQGDSKMWPDESVNNREEHILE